MDDYGLESVILVTSSFHLPRARLLFERAGVRVHPYPVDFKATGRSKDWLSLIPSANAFMKTSSGLREYIGRIYYLLKFM